MMSPQICVMMIMTIIIIFAATIMKMNLILAITINGQPAILLEDPAILEMNKTVSYSNLQCMVLMCTTVISNWHQINLNLPLVVILLCLVDLTTGKFAWGNTPIESVEQ